MIFMNKPRVRLGAYLLFQSENLRHRATAILSLFAETVSAQNSCSLSGNKRHLILLAAIAASDLGHRAL